MPPERRREGRIDPALVFEAVFKRVAVDMDLHESSQSLDASLDTLMERVARAFIKIGRGPFNGALYSGAPFNGALYHGAPFNGALYIMV